MPTAPLSAPPEQIAVRSRPARRLDIQGLRAVAVLAVLFFHIGGWCGGGYIGVDVFFVISGYVIAMAYLEKFTRAPRLSTAIDFFQRRVLRLAPALFVMVLVTLVLADAILPPTENKFLAFLAGLSAVMQKSNLYFAYMGTNYWLDDLSRNPFLHTWSLGVEWQFYALFPLPFLIAALIRRPLTAPSGLAILVLVLAASLWLFLTSDATRAFYGPLSRFWQFALGILAFLATRRKGTGRDDSPLSLVLLAGIMVLALLPPTLLLPAAGSVLASFLAAGLLYVAPSDRSLTGRMLTNSAFQSVGSASYSIYLTHWPVAVLGRLLLAEGVIYDVMLVVLSLTTGFLLSWSVEYRLMHAARPGRAVLACLAVVALAYVGERRRSTIPSLPWYANPPLVAHVDGYHNYWWTEIDGARNEFRHAAQFAAGELFRRSVPGTDVQEAVAAHSDGARWIVGIGNSYIQSAGTLLRRYALEHDANLALYHIANCSPDNEARCTRSFDHVLQSLAGRKDQITLVYIAFRGLEDPQGIAGRLVSRLLARLDHPGAQVVIQGPSPAYRYDPHACLSLVAPCASTQSLPVDIAALEAAERNLERLFPSRSGLTTWAPYRDLCTDGMCLVREQGASLFMDTDHFSMAGQHYLYPHFLQHLTRQDHTHVVR
ncbi:acyltransferase family protein [Hyphomicrobium sp.]|uniref:acyltransferase family protein n=1 Tax=Hyphomicrobium sp. TaxID=82 RepID=UPI0025C6B08B|nr:acyltransferase family protein [Hyphomicrobium sp.]MCC7253706.1 acyltransferase [Hyphomicrobium sp.]